MCQPTGSCRKLTVFDFDDTLVKTDSRIFLSRADGTSAALTPAEFVARVLGPGEAYDFREFLVLINARAIGHTDALLRAAHAEHGPGRVAVLSARSVPDPIEQYLASQSLVGVHVAALGNADPQAKHDWLSARLEQGDVDELEFFDDSARNVAIVRSLQERHPHVVVRAYLVEAA